MPTDVCCCGISQHQDEDEVQRRRRQKQAHKVSRNISRQLAEAHHNELSCLKLLLLGTGESGKSTILKQMKIIHINGFKTEEKLEFIPNIKQNIRDAFLSVLGGMRKLNIPFEKPENAQLGNKLMEDSLADNYEYPQSFYDCVKYLWQDSGMQASFFRSNEYQLIDPAKYFIDRIEVIRQTDYVPTLQDILRCRILTNAINEVNFNISDGSRTKVNFKVFDVGGQQGARKKWIQLFDSVTAILFLADCSSFDMTLREDRTKNRLFDAFKVFHQIWTNKYLQSVPVLVFINKIDVLEEKIRAGRSMASLFLAANHWLLKLQRAAYTELTCCSEALAEIASKNVIASAVNSASATTATVAGLANDPSVNAILSPLVQPASLIKAQPHNEAGKLAKQQVAIVAPTCCQSEFLLLGQRPRLPCTQNTAAKLSEVATRPVESNRCTCHCWLEANDKPPCLTCTEMAAKDCNISHDLVPRCCQCCKCPSARPLSPMLTSVALAPATGTPVDQGLMCPAAKKAAAGYRCPGIIKTPPLPLHPLAAQHPPSLPPLLCHPYNNNIPNSKSQPDCQWHHHYCAITATSNTITDKQPNCAKLLSISTGTDVVAAPGSLCLNRSMPVVDELTATMPPSVCSSQGLSPSPPVTPVDVVRTRTHNNAKATANGSVKVSGNTVLRGSVRFPGHQLSLALPIYSQAAYANCCADYAVGMDIVQLLCSRPFQDFQPTADERREFLHSYPLDEVGRTISSLKTRQRGYETPNTHPETIRAACYIKNLFVEITKRQTYGNNSDSSGCVGFRRRKCLFYYTCAVNTDNIQKVLDGCRAFLIEKHLERFGIL